MVLRDWLPGPKELTKELIVAIVVGLIVAISSSVLAYMSSLWFLIPIIFAILVPITLNLFFPSSYKVNAFLGYLASRPRVQTPPRPPSDIQGLSEGVSFFACLTQGFPGRP